MKHIAKLAASVLALTLILSGCGSNTNQTPATGTDAGTSTNAVTVRVGASPSPHAEILEQIKPILAEQGINLEIITFDDYVLPNTALENGDLDANYFQHQPYLNDFNEKNNTHIVTIAKVHYEPLGVYAGKSATLADLPDGAKVGIPADNTNGARALQLLAAQGLIEVDPTVGLSATEQDVTKNPKNLKFIAMESAALPASLPDLDIAVINGNYALGANIGSDKLLATEDKDSEAAQTYANILCVKEGNETRPELVALKEAILSETVRTYINAQYNGVVVPVF